MIALGLEYGPGGDKSGTREFRERLNAAGIGVCFKGTDDAGLIFEAQEAGYPDNILIYRVSTAGQGNQQQFDVPDYSLPPSTAAANHWQITRAKWPPELDPARVWMECCNEVRAHIDPDRPCWGNMHPVAWVGRFLVEYAQIANGNGYKVCGPAYSSGEPEPGDWQLDGMLDWLRYCAENPDKAALSVHEYNYGMVPYDDNYPWHYGRFQAAIAAADLAGIPRTFPVFITEFGWTYTAVPSFNDAVYTLTKYSELSARFPQLKAAALWSLRGGFDNVDKLLSAWITENGNPFANWIIQNQYPDDPQPQPTDPAFGSTLPNGGDIVTEYKDVARFDIEKPVPAGGRIVIAAWDADETEQLAWQAVDIPEGTGVLRLKVQEPKLVNPNPPPVSNPLPQGALFMDVSANNALVDVVEAKKNGVQGIGIRLSSGIRKNTDTTDENGIDKRAWYYMEQAKINNMPWLGYHFSNENYDDVEQVQHFLNIANLAIADGYIPEMGLFIDFETPQAPIQGSPTSEDRIQQQLTALAQERPSFILDYGTYTSIGWWNGKVPNAETWVPPLGLKLWASAWPADSVLVDGYPPAWWHPTSLAGFDEVYYWQWTPAGGDLVGHSVPNLDLSFVGNTAVVPGKPPTPPQGKTVDFTPYLVPSTDIGQFLVFEKAAGGSIDHQTQVRDGIVYIVKRATVGTNYEELRIKDGFIQRRYDTSPADGHPYKLDDGTGDGWSNWMPVTMTEGESYLRQPQLTRYDVAQNCQQISSTAQPSYITFAKFYEFYTLPGGLVKENVCELHWTWLPGGEVLERYFVAPDRWYVQWGNGDALHYLNEEPQGRELLPLSIIGCLQ